MPNDQTRRRVAREAARMMYSRRESDYTRAKKKAANRVYGGPFNPADLPSNREVRDEILAMAEMQYPDHDSMCRDIRLDRFQVYEMLLVPLERVKENPKTRPEGDVLYHSLQVFELARQQLPYDEEFLLAALLHDVGKAIDPDDHIAAGLEALDGYITPRTQWLIEHHTDALGLLDGSLGARSRRRLETNESFEELEMLARCDRGGHERGLLVATIDEALAYLRNLAAMCGE